MPNDLALQTNSSECGLFVLQNAFRLMAGTLLPPVLHPQMNSFAGLYEIRLMKKFDLLQDFGKTINDSIKVPTDDKTSELPKVILPLPLADNMSL